MKAKPLRCRECRHPEFDPIEWAVYALVVSGSSLLLSLETKIANRKKAQNDEAEKKAKAGNRARLRSIRKVLSETSAIVRHIHKIGKLIENPISDSIGRFSMEFESVEVLALFDDDIDKLTERIGMFNRLCNEIDVWGFELDSDDMKEFVEMPLREIKELTRNAIRPETHPLERFLLVQKLLDQYGSFIEGLEDLTS